MLSSETSISNKTKIFLYNMSHFNSNEFGFVGLRMPFYAATHCHDLRYLVGKVFLSIFTLARKIYIWYFKFLGFIFQISAKY